MINPHLLVAIDGPAGAGKSTVARQVSKRLGLNYIDTGAMYRGIAWKILREGIDIENEQELDEIIETTFIAMSQGHLYLDGLRLAEEIRTTEVSTWASRIAKMPKIRQFLVRKQQEIAKKQSVVMDGRDIGTFVLPDADVKFFLTASIHQRALRRYEELRQKGMEVDIENLQLEIKERDKMDSTRKYAPLRQAKGAILIDTTDKSIDDVVNIIYKHCEQKLNTKKISQK